MSYGIFEHANGDAKSKLPRAPQEPALILLGLPVGSEAIGNGFAICLMRDTMGT